MFFTLSDISLSEMDVFEALSSLDTSKACGADEISPKILRSCTLATHSPSIYAVSFPTLSPYGVALSSNYLCL